jgi:hypothetical protein
MMLFLRSKKGGRGKKIVGSGCRASQEEYTLSPNYPHMINLSQVLTGSSVFLWRGTDDGNTGRNSTRRWRMQSNQVRKSSPHADGKVRRLAILVPG